MIVRLRSDYISIDVLWSDFELNFYTSYVDLPRRQITITSRLYLNFSIARAYLSVDDYYDKR